MIRTPRIQLGMLVLALMILGAGGCNRRPKLHQVQGQVTYQGQRVTEGIVVFENDAAGVSLTTRLQADGSFVVGSYEGLGLPTGSYRLAVRPPVPDQKSLTELMQPTQSSYPNIPEKYRSSSTSGLTAEVQKGTNDIQIDMQDAS